jgi:hypothetical protein
MSVQTTTSRISYTGNGSSTAFAYNFKILDQTHLKVYVAGVLKTLTTDYTVAGVGGAAGGTVNFVIAPALAASIVIARNVPVNQLITTVNNDTIFATVFDQAIDKLTMIAQQLSTSASRGLVLADNDPTSGALTLPTDRANKYLRFDANGLPSTIDSQITTLYYGALTADPSTRPDGSAMQAGDLYYNSASAQFKVYSGAAWALAIPTASLTLTNYAETAATSKTTFTITGGYTASSVFIYLNGVLLESAEYTATNGTTVVLGTACAVGDEFRCVGFSSFSVANTLPATGGTISGNLAVTGTLSVTGALKKSGVDVVAVTPGASGNLLTSDGTVWTSAAPPSSGVTSLVAGNGITVSAATGAVTVSQNIYTGSSATNTSFPIGSVVLAADVETCAAFIPLNDTLNLYVYTSNGTTNNTFKFVSTNLNNAPGAGYTALTGTWRNRGRGIAGSDRAYAFQRVA